MPGKRQSRGIYLLKSGHYCARVRVFGREVSQTFPHLRLAKSWREEMRFNAERAPKNLVYIPHHWVASVDDKVKRIEKDFDEFQDALEWLKDAESRIALGLPISPNGQNPIFRDYTQDWRGPNHTAGMRTRADYASVIATYLEPFFGEMKISAISTGDIREWTKYMENAGKSKATIQRARAQLKQIMRTAYAEGHSLTDIFAGVRNERVPKKRAKALDHREVELLVACSGEHSLMVGMHFHTGLRPSELRALKPSDIDLEAKQLTVSSAWRTDKKTWELGPTKTGQSRTIPIHDSIVEPLRTLLVTTPREDFLFRHDNGKVISDDFYRRSIIKKAAKKAGVPWVTPYTLRHTYASHLISIHGAPVTVVSNLMGHSSPVETMATYAHFFPNDNASFVNKLGVVFARDSE